jgi:hypothetical protein
MKRFTSIAVASIFAIATAATVAIAAPTDRNPHSRGTRDRGLEHLNPRALEVRAAGTNPISRATPAIPATPATPGSSAGPAIPAKPATPAVPPAPRGKPGN